MSTVPVSSGQKPNVEPDVPLTAEEKKLLERFGVKPEEVN